MCVYVNRVKAVRSSALENVARRAIRLTKLAVWSESDLASRYFLDARKRLDSTYLLIMKTCHSNKRDCNDTYYRDGEHKLATKEVCQRLGCLACVG